MSCFCAGNVDRLARLRADLDASLALSASAQAALAFHGRLCFGLPDLPEPPYPWPGPDPAVGALASLTAVAQLRAQARASLGFDLDTEAGIKATARLTATLQARMAAIAALELDLDAWLLLGRLNDVSLGLAAVFQACLSVSARAEAKAAGTAALDFVAAPPSWGGSNLVCVTALAGLAARSGGRLDAAWVATLRETARLMARTTAPVRLDLAAAATLMAGFSAIARLGATLGIDPLATGFASVRAAVAANYAATVSLAGQLGIDFSQGAGRLPDPHLVPGLHAAVLASLQARLDVAAAVSAELRTAAVAEVDLSASAMVAASLSVALSATLRLDAAFRTPCGTCDLPSIMAALPTDAAVPAEQPPGPDLRPAAKAPGTPGAPNNTAPNNTAPAAPAGADAAAPGAAAQGMDGQDGPAAATGDGAGGAGGGGGSGGGGGGGSGGGGGGSGGGGSGGAGKVTVMTAQLMCTFGVAPSVLSVLPVNRTNVGKQVAANIMDHVPMVNIKPFGLCTSPVNPTVISATAAALGVFTPMPCLPATPAPWVPGSPTVLLGKQPMLSSLSRCMCTWTGVISIVSPGQVQTGVP